MAGDEVPAPSSITLHQTSRVLEIAFSDGHATGIYSWEYLYHLGENQDRLWAEYLEKMHRAGASRE